MRYTMIIYLILIACTASLSQAQDLLSPMALGESMSMPLDPDLLRKAENAGVRVGTGGTYGSIEGGSSVVPLGSGSADPGANDPQPGSSAGLGSDAVEAAGAFEAGANLTGLWSFTLKDDLIRQLDLALFQNGAAILGYGSISSGNGTQAVTAGGSVAGGRIDLLVTSQGGLSMYKLNLASEGDSLSGSYSAFTSAGETWSGVVTGSIPGQQARLTAKSHEEPHASTISGPDPLALGQGTSTGAQASGASAVAPNTGSSISKSSFSGSSLSGSSSRMASSSGGVSSSQSVSMGSSGGSYSSVSSISSSVYG